MELKGVNETVCGVVKESNMAAVVEEVASQELVGDIGDKMNFERVINHG